ncbi:MAG: CocE/NonD family hydrolase [Solirubrobacteraceae bacterium]
MRPLRLALVAFLLATAPAGASSAPDAGRAFRPPPLPAERFAVSEPVVRIVEAADGVDLYTETWRPAPKDGAVPPAHVPVVIEYSPYSTKGAPENPDRMKLLVSRGYAFTQVHVRGSGGSGGCIEQTAEHEVDDGARIVEDAGERAPWASGRVGLYGISYRGGTQIATATGPDRSRLRSLKAIVVGAPVASAYEFFAHDGVPHLLQGSVNVLAYSLALSSPWESPDKLPERPGCQPLILAGSLDQSGDYTEHFAVRDHTRHLDRLTAATLLWHGSADTRVSPHGEIGLFDAIPAGVPKHGLFGIWDHEHPDAFRSNTPQPRADWERGDWDAMTVAWYERYLRGRRNGIAKWPVAEVQGTDGQWRTALDWPRKPGGLTRQLRLGPGGALGAPAPAGSTTYTEAGEPDVTLTGVTYAPGTAAVFETSALTGRLELYGMPRLDLWLQLDKPDAHVAVKLEALDASGARTMPEARTIGARSMRHLAPFVNGRFRQATGAPAPVGKPFRVLVRLDPTDLVVPAGGRLRLTISGSVQAYDGLDGLQEGAGMFLQGPTAPSGSGTAITVLHSCATPSVLRFTVPGKRSALLDVQEKDQKPETLGAARRTPAPAVDGGGLAAAPRAGC